MSDEKQKTSNTLSSENLLEDNEETLEITINTATNEAVLKNPKDNKTIKLKANIENTIEEIKEESEFTPLTPEEFEEGIRRLDGLGLTFSVDLLPSIKSKDESTTDIIDAEEFEEIQIKYPILPREVGLVAHNTITGNRHRLDLLGGEKFFEEKSKLVEELILTGEYREEFFFQHALKVPYFESIDWEINLKTHENGVKHPISVPYALLMLSFHNPNPNLRREDVHQNITVAANRNIIDELLATLTAAKLALDKSEKIRDYLSKMESLEE